MQQKHFISHPDQTRHARSRIKLLQKSNRERSKTQIVSNTRALRWFSSFSPEVKKARSSLHWDCIFFVECNRSENQFQENLNASNRTKHAKTEGKNDLASLCDQWVQKRGPKPLQKLIGAANLQSKKSRFLAPPKQNKNKNAFSISIRSSTARGSDTSVL